MQHIGNSWQTRQSPEEKVILDISHYPTRNPTGFCQPTPNMTSSKLHWVISLLFRELGHLLSKSRTVMILSFPMILLATSRLGKAARHDKKNLERTQRHKEVEGAAAESTVSGPDRGLGFAIQPGHSNSERMLMRLLWSLRCFPCFQHLQGPHGATSIKTTKWEIWTFFCDAGGLFAFQPGRPFSVPPLKRKDKKESATGGVDE